MFCTFLLQMNMAKRRHDFTALLALKPMNQINRKTKFALTCSALAFSGREKFGNSFYYKILGMV